MKTKKVLIASMLAGVSALTLGAATACDGLPTWLGGKEPTYKVVISINGVDTEVEVTEGAIPQKPEDPVKEGFDFKGWYLDEACTQEYKFDTPLNGDSSLYAYFTEKEYVVTFVVDGVSSDVTFKWSETPTFSTPKKDGYVFKNWCLDEACSQDYAFTEPVREPLTVYAKFVEAYKVQYVVTPNASTDNSETVETELNTAPVKPRNPQIEGYNFEGWFLDAEFTTAYNFDTVLDAGTAIYAKLVEKQYTVTYVVGEDGTTIGDPVTYNYWTAPEKPADPTYNDWHFYGWYLDEEYTNSYDFSYTLKEDSTVYAYFMEYKPVYTLEELLAIKDDLSANYVLMNDIKVKGIWDPIENFSGKFDGNGHKISNFKIKETQSTTAFILMNNGTIKNLTLSGFDYSADCFPTATFGVLVAVNNGTIENCAVDNVDGKILFRSVGTVTYTASYEAYYGGLVAKNTANGVVKNSYFNADIVFSYQVTADNGAYNYGLGTGHTVYLGGAIGQNLGTVISVSADFNMLLPEADENGATNTVSVNGSWGDAYGRQDASTVDFMFGGLVAANEGTIAKSKASIGIDLYTNHNEYGYIDEHIGGLVGKNTGTVTESVSTGTISNSGKSRSLDIGGFVYENNGTVKDSYANTVIKSNSIDGKVAGFAAYSNAVIERCYASGTIESESTGKTGGFVAEIGNAAQVNFCFTVVDVAAKNTVGVFVDTYVKGTDCFYLCYYSSEATVTKDGEAFDSANVSSVVGKTTAQIFSRELLLDDAWWNNDEEIWVIDGENAPTLVWQNA